MVDFQKSNCEGFIKRFLPLDFPVAVLTAQDSEAEGIAEILKRFPALGPRNAQGLRQAFLALIRPPTSAATLSIDLGPFQIAAFWVNLEDIGKASIYLPPEYRFPQNLEEGIAPWGIAHDTGHLALARLTGVYAKLTDPNRAAGIRRKIREMRGYFQQKFNVDIQEQHFLKFEEALCDLFGCAVASREAKVDFGKFTEAVSDTRMLFIRRDLEHLAQHQRDHWEHFMYYVAPFLDHAAVQFSDKDTRTGQSVADQDLFAHCLNFLVESYRSTPKLFDAPRAGDSIPSQPFSDPALQAQAQQAETLEPRELLRETPLVRFMALMQRAQKRLAALPGNMGPARGPSRSDDPDFGSSTPA